MLGSHSAPALTVAVRFIAQWLLAVPVLLTVIAIAIRRKWRADVIKAIVAGALTIILVKLGATAYFHARPFVAYGRLPLVVHAPDNAFPSDHLAACGLAFAYLWTRNRPFAVVVALCAALIGAARVLAGLHWPIDIVAGFIFGILAVLLARIATRGFQRRERTV